MVAHEVQRRIKQRLEEEFARILTASHAEMDAHYIRLAAESWSIRSSEDLRKPFSNGSRRLVEVEIDMNAVEILIALSRLKDGTYGRCCRCQHEISQRVLEAKRKPKSP